MKKLIVTLSLACLGFAAQADVSWSWWLENPTVQTDFALGLASRCKQVNTLELSLVYNASPVLNGAQLTFGLNDADSVCPLQMACINRGKDPTVQLGFLNIAKKSVFDMAFVNVADDAKFQLGFLNFNKKGFIPVCIFINFDPTIFE